MLQNINPSIWPRVLSNFLKDEETPEILFHTGILKIPLENIRLMRSLKTSKQIECLYLELEKRQLKFLERTMSKM